MCEFEKNVEFMILEWRWELEFSHSTLENVVDDDDDGKSELKKCRKLIKINQAKWMWISCKWNLLTQLDNRHEILFNFTRILK